MTAEQYLLNEHSVGGHSGQIIGACPACTNSIEPDQRPVDSIFPERRAAIASKTCSMGNHPVSDEEYAAFSPAGQSEFKISGACEPCFDKAFAEPTIDWTLSADEEDAIVTALRIAANLDDREPMRTAYIELLARFEGQEGPALDPSPLDEETVDTIDKSIRALRIGIAFENQTGGHRGDAPSEEALEALRYERTGGRLGSIVPTSPYINCGTLDAMQAAEALETDERLVAQDEARAE